MFDASALGLLLLVFVVFHKCIQPHNPATVKEEIFTQAARSFVLGSSNSSPTLIPQHLPSAILFYFYLELHENPVLQGTCICLHLLFKR